MKNEYDRIISWYQENKRDLPWRKDKDPYHVWLSEIMLQQTRIEAVIDYYYRFLKEVPTIQDLANIDDEKLLKLWEGLGYYNRARHLKEAACLICKKYHGIFPDNFKEIINLPGIGEYSASAISSICFNEKQVTIDGNVLRVYTRYYNDQRNIDLNSSKKEIRKKLMRIIDHDPGDFNEGLMELGETICLPNTKPLCDKCPLKNTCKAHSLNNWDQFPLKNNKKKQKIIDYTIFLLIYKDKIAIHKRENSLLNQMWEFPNIETKKIKKEIKEDLKKKNVKKGIKYKHVFTHQIWNMSSYIIFLDKKLDQYDWVNISTLKEQYALPSAFKPFLKDLENINF